MRRTTPRPTLGAPFANLFVSNLLSSLGDGIARVAVPLLAVQLTDDPLLISAISALALLPWLFFAIPAGILIDRIDRRQALALAQAVRTTLGIALVVLVATGHLTIWWLYVVIFVYGAFETVYDGAIRAVVPSVVERRDLHRANSRIEAGEIVTQNFVAAPVTSWLFAIAAVIPLGLNVAAFAVAGGLALVLPRVAAGAHRTTPSTERAVPFRRQFADGYRFIMGNQMLRKLWLLSSFTGIWHSAMLATWVLFVLDKLGVPQEWYGAFLVSGAVGGLLATVVVAPMKQALGSGRAMAIGTITSSAVFLVAGLAPVTWVAVLAFAIGSAGGTVWNILVMSLRQAVIPSHLLGRVHGTWRTVLWGTMPLGSLIGGLLARVDLTTPLIVGGIIATLSYLVYYRFLVSLPDPADLEDPTPQPSTVE
jgi:MFS family permease